ncbi:MAG: Protease HtpX [Chlamydiae bacterium]|nr:Protease HtpX [Chlamydiota bacterium]
MTFLKRLLLFFVVNFLVLTTITFIIQMLGLDQSLGFSTQALFIFCLLYGSLGSFISLLLSKRIVRWIMRIKMIPSNTHVESEKQLYAMVENLSKKAGLKSVPEIGIFQSPEMNAFATGPSKNNSLVAISSGLLENMDTKKIEAILGHEMGHIVNGDMVTMALIQGIINAFVMFFARIFAHVVLSGRNNRGRVNPWGYYLLVQLFQFVFALLGFMIVAGFSRRREYRADKKGAEFTSKEQMIGALEHLKTSVEDRQLNHASVNAFKIHTRVKWLEFLSTHPPLDKRIQALKAGF